MAQIEIKVPDIGDFKDIPVIELLVKPGDTIAKEDPLVTLESDKATMEVPSTHAGTVKELRVKIGDKASEVMRMGRKRSRAASTEAAETDRPSCVFSSANSTIRIAFFAARPRSVTRPIWKYTSFASGARPNIVKTRLLIQIAASAPNVPNGSASITDSGSDHLSYCAARIRNAMKAPATSAMIDVPPDFFSWYEAPLQSKLKSSGRDSFATFSIFS